jgi:hypothetical protein
VSETLDRVAGGVRALIRRFEATQAGSVTEHLRIVDDPQFHAQIRWLKRNRRDLWDELRPVILDSWHRVYPQGEQRAHAKRVAIELHHEYRQVMQRKGGQRYERS